MTFDTKDRRLKLVVVLVIFIVSIVGLLVIFFDKPQGAQLYSTGQYKRDVRNEKVLSFARSYNDSLRDKESNYGYDLVASTVKEDPRFDTPGEYSVWVSRIVADYPELGTDAVNIIIPNSKVFGELHTGDASGLIFELEEYEFEKFRIAEILTYSTGDDTTTKYSGNNCHFFFQEKSPGGENCPKWL